MRGPGANAVAVVGCALGLVACGDGADLRPPVDVMADEEYEVLSAALREQAARDGAVLHVVEARTTSCAGWLECSTFEQAQPDFSVPGDVLADFRARNAGSAQLGDRFDAELQLVLLTDVVRASLDPGLDCFTALEAAFPGAHGVTYLGRVGFDHRLTTALVSIGHQSAALAGAGYLEVYRKIDGGWVFQARRLIWIS